MIEIEDITHEVESVTLVDNLYSDIFVQRLAHHFRGIALDEVYGTPHLLLRLRDYH